MFQNNPFPSNAINSPQSLNQTTKDEKYKKYDETCKSLRYIANYYSISELALLWCGVEDIELEEENKKCTPQGYSGIARGIFTHPYIPCIRVKTNIIAEALESDKLACARDGGAEYLTSECHIAWHRRKIKGSTFKEFLEKHYPNEKPSFLFDDIERQSDKRITVENYMTIQQENETLTARLEKAKLVYAEQKKRIDELEIKNKELNEQLGNNISPLDPRTEQAYLKLLKAFKEIMLGNTGRKNNFHNDEAIKEHILEKYPSTYGLKSSTLDTRFSSINKTSLDT